MQSQFPNNSNPFTFPASGQGQQPFSQSTGAQNSDFPSLSQSQNASQQQTASSAPTDNIFAASFNPSSVTEWNPQAQQKEEFPDLLSMPAKPKKAKKVTKTKEEIEAEKQKALDALPTKGKPSSFFFYQDPYNLPQELMAFMFANYPQYSSAPHDMIAWLRGEAQRLEYEEEQRRVAESSYDAPNRKQQQEEYDSEDDFLQESNFGQQQPKAQKKGKASSSQTAAKKKQASDAAKGLKVAEPTIKVRTVTDITVKVDKDRVQEVDETRVPASIVFMGHVDAGKSTICGQLMFKMGCVDQRQIEKYQQEAKKLGRDSWWLAYCMDNNEEEKAKGKTVEVGRATFNTSKKQYTVLDAPGHKDYVPNMIMGAALADLAGLVISARKGEFEAGFEKDGQTREHLQLARSLGVQKLIVVVNKMDEPSVSWRKERYDEIVEKLGPFLASQGYEKDDVTYVPISGLGGDNIIELVDPAVCPWYKGNTLIHIMDNIPVDQRKADAPLRIPVLEKVQHEKGIFAHGKIEQGSIKLGDKIQIMPSGFPAQVGEILDHKNEYVMYARPGENVQIKLVHVDQDSKVNRGDVICAREDACPVTMLVEAEMDVYELLAHKPILTKAYECVMHCHTYAEDIYIKEILSSKSKNGEQTDQPKFVKEYSTCTVRIQTKEPLACEKFATLPQLARFTLRDQGRTIASGRILKYKPHKVVQTVQVANATKTAAPMKTSDNATTLIFDGETGEVVKPKAALDTIAE